ncbi:MAG: hypothetical protein E7271_09375 [Lachnospiraceae bacterium]|jgi:hypothetical protein|nr:hypothetical protein [Lachnospiraceae bacterium]
MKKKWINKVKIVLCTTLLLLLCGTTVHANSNGISAKPLSDDDLPVGGWQPHELREVDVDVEVEVPQITKHTRRINSDKDSVFVKGAGTVGYEALTDKQKELYAQFDEAAADFMQSSEDLNSTNMGSGKTAYVVGQFNYIGLGLELEDAYKVFFAYDYDHPAYYWISNTVWSSSVSIYLCTEAEYTSANTRTTINNKIINGVKEYAALAEQGSDTLDKIAIIHDRIVQDVDYAYESGSNTPETARWAHSVHGVFDETHHQVVCEGYADTFSLMMNYMSIPNYYIVGTANSSGAGGGGNHAWNAVSDDGGATYMYMDLTWDDNKENGYYYKYFGMPKTDFEGSHTAYTSSGTGFEWLYDLPDNISNTLEGTYYYKGGFYCASTDYENFAKYVNVKSHRTGPFLTFLTSSMDKVGEVTLKLGFDSYSYYTITYLTKTYYIPHFKITTPIDISDAVVTMPTGSYIYSSKENKPIPKSVTLYNVKLLRDVNYSLSYQDNINAGENTAKVIVTGMGNYEGTRDDVLFSIEQKSVTISWGTDEFEFDGNSHCPTATVEGVISGDTCNAVVTGAAKDVGTYIATVSGLTNSNYILSSATTKRFTIKNNGSQPQPVVTTLPPQITVSSDYKVTLTAGTVTDDTLDKIYYRINDGEWKEYTSAFPVYKEFAVTAYQVTKTAKVKSEEVTESGKEYASSISAVYTGTDKIIGNSVTKDEVTVTVHYPNSPDETTTKFTLNNATITKVGTNKVTISYKEYANDNNCPTLTTSVNVTGINKPTEATTSTEKPTEATTSTEKTTATTEKKAEVPTSTEKPTEAATTTDSSTTGTAKEEGTTLDDDDATAAYVVTSTQTETPSVSYSSTVKATAKTVTVPETVSVDGVEYKVTSIADNAFKGSKKIKSIQVSSNVISIGNNAFANCKKLKVITIRSTKLNSKNLKKNAFKGISSNTVIKVPKKMLKNYKKLFRKKGLSKKVKIKKI